MSCLSLTNEELHQKTICAATDEKNATLVLLNYLHEVDRRRLYSERGYPSLWMYVHQELKYSEAQTSERVGAMRLMARIPEVKSSIEEQRLSLTTASKLASFAKREKLPMEKTVELLHRIEDLPKREVERILFAEQKMPESRPDVVRQVGAETVRIAFDADEEFMGLVTRMKDLQTDPSASLQEIFKKVMKEYMIKREPKTQSVETDVRRSASRPAEVATKVEKERKYPSRYIPAAVKAFVRQRSGDRCEYVAMVIDPITKKTTRKRCDHRGQLQFDHREPFAMGGENTKENIRHLCASHNRHLAKKVFGEEKIATEAAGRGHRRS